MYSLSRIDDIIARTRAYSNMSSVLLAIIRYKITISLHYFSVLLYCMTKSTSKAITVRYNFIYRLKLHFLNDFMQQHISLLVVDTNIYCIINYYVFFAIVDGSKRISCCRLFSTTFLYSFRVSIIVTPLLIPSTILCFTNSRFGSSKSMI